jgi:hypothetical protein
VNESGTVLIAIGLAIALAALCFALRFVELSAASLIIVIKVAGVMVIVLGLASILDDVAPRRQSIEELYRDG